VSELAFIEWVRNRVAADPRLAGGGRLLVPPGDDAALVAAGEGEVLCAADMLMDGIHFDLRVDSPRLAGRKALAVNLSDIAAMGGKPTACLVSLALPKSGGRALGEAVTEGVFELAATYGVAVAGGDTNSWDGPLVINVSILGAPPKGGPVKRAGARPGDVVFVTGPLGGSLPSKRHLLFTPRLAEAEELVSRYGVTAMIDVSDGLASDLRHILAESRVSGRLDAAAIPVHPDVAAAFGSLDAAAALAHALGDGEDFELCFTVGPEIAARLLAERPDAAWKGGAKLSKIGTILPAAASPGALVFKDGRSVPNLGWRHALT
jgi:thiamine-monophosphate kinase